MEWPGVAQLSCADCAKYHYSIPDGELETYETDDGFKPVERSPEIPPPCDQCPRGGPENEQRLTLSDRNYAAVSLYHKLRATRGAYQLDPKIARCPVFAENMWLIENAIESAKAAIKSRAIREASEKSATRDRGS